MKIELLQLLSADRRIFSRWAPHPLVEAAATVAASPHWSTDVLTAHRDEALRALVAHCYENVPYYRDLMDRRRLRPSDFRATSDLSKLPLLTKDIVRANADALRARNVPDAECQFRRSGGTTGEPIRVALNRRARAFEVAAYYRGLYWMGYRPGMPVVRLTGGSLGFYSPQSWRGRLQARLLRARLLPAFELNARNVHSYVESLRAARGGTLIGYASALIVLAELMEAAGLRGVPLRSAISTAETLPDEWRNRISSVLGCPVYSYYGCGEVNSIAYQRSDLEGYVVSDEHVVLETVDAGGDVGAEDGTGEFAVTPLFNYAMPLLRYLNGDAGTIQRPSPRASGLPHLRITTLEGRVVERLLATDGHWVSGSLPPHLVFRSGAPVWKWQVVQQERDLLDFHFACSSGQRLMPEFERRLADVFRQVLGADLRVRFIEGQFEVTSSGKHRFIINRITERERDGAKFVEGR